MEGMKNFANDKNLFMNFAKADIMYDYAVQFLGPQLTFLGISLNEEKNESDELCE